MALVKVFGRVFGKGLGHEDSRIVYQQVDSSEIADISTTCFAMLWIAISPSTSFKRFPAAPFWPMYISRAATTQYPVSRSRSVIPRPMLFDAPATIATFVLIGESSPTMLRVFHLLP